MNKSKQECYINSQKVITTTDIERKQNAEILTPLSLVNEMLSKIPEDAWTDISTGHLPLIFDPCVGKGAFVVVVYDLLWEKLEDLIPDEENRRATILEEMLYFADINPYNINVTKLILDPQNHYKLNAYCGDTLEMKFDTKFDIIVGNPPFNNSQNNTGKKGGGDSLWNKFVIKSIKCLKPRGYLLYVHPSGWRKPESSKSKYYGLFKLMTQENQMLYLSIHGLKDGKNTFDCGTRYDWYVIHHTSKYTTTEFNDEKNNRLIIDMNKFKWLPNYNIDTIQSILAEESDEKCPIIYNRSNYGSDKKYTQKYKTNEFKYPCVHSTPRKGIRYMYSSVNDRGHFGISKVIFGESGIGYVIIDMEGKYGMTQGAMSIEVSSIEEANNIKKALLSVKFKQLLNACSFSNFRIDWRMFKYLKKDFWKEFI